MTIVVDVSRFCGIFFYITHGGLYIFEKIMVKYLTDSPKHNSVDTGSFKYIVNIAAVTTKFSSQPRHRTFLLAEFCFN